MPLDAAPEAPAPTAPTAAADPDDAYWSGSATAAPTAAPAPAAAAPAPDADPDDAYWGVPAPKPVAPPAPVESKDEGILHKLRETLVDPALTGFQKARQTAAILERTAGRSNEGVGASIAAAQAAIPQRGEFRQIADEQIKQAGSAFGVLDAYLSYPRAALTSAIEGLVEGGGSLVAAAGGGAGGGAAAGAMTANPIGIAAGATVGTVLGAGGAGYLDAYGQTVVGTLHDHGVDMTDKAAVTAALNDPALMSQANEAARQAGIPAAVINAVSFGIAGRVFKPVAGAIGSKLGALAGKAAGATGEVAAQAAVGGGGQAATQEWQSGQISDPNAIVRDALDQTAIGATFAGVHAVGGHRLPPAKESEGDVVDHAQTVARAAVAAQGGDLLTQTLAASHVNAVVGAHYHAAQYEMHLEEGAASAATAHNDALQQLQLETPAEEAARNPSAAFDLAEAAKASTAPSADEAYAQRDAQTDAAKNADYTAAQNQVGDQTIAGADKSGANDPSPTIADALSPDQMQAFKTLKERRAAEMAKISPKPSVTGRLKAQNPDDNFTPYVEPKAATDGAPMEPAKTLADRRAAAEAPATEKPPQTLAERRAAATRDTATPRPDVPVADDQPQQNGIPPGLADRRAAAGAPTAADVDTAAHESAYSPENDRPTPTHAQYEAGNYAKGHIDIQGMPISIEHPAGSERPLSSSGDTRTMPAHYGYFKGTLDGDGMHTDVMVGQHPEHQTAYVVDHLDVNGAYSQHKVLLGFNNKIAAMRAYRETYPDHPVGHVSEVSTPKLKDWLANGDTSKAYAENSDGTVGRRDTGTESVREAQPETAAADSPATAVSVDSLPAALGPYSLVDKGQRDGSERPAEGVLSDDDQTGRVSPESHRATAGHGPGEEPKAGERDVSDATEVPRGRDSETDQGARPGQLAGKDRTLADRRAEARLPKEGSVPEPTRVVDDETGFKTLAERRAAKIEGRAPNFRDSDAPTGRDSTGESEAPARMTAEQAEDHIRPIRDATGATIKVHDNANTLPQTIQAAMKRGNHLDPRGVHDPKTGIVHIVAGAHADSEQLQRTVAHELAHRNMREMLGPEYARAMQDIHDNIHDTQTSTPDIKKGTAREWIRDYMESHNLDRDKPADQQRAANEYAAHLAEHPTENPGILRRAIDAVRAGLRRLGLVHEWTDNDIRAMLRKSGAEPAHTATDEPHFADKEVDDQPVKKAEAALAGKATVEEQSGEDRRSAGKKALDAADEGWTGTLKRRLEFISTHNLKDFMPNAKERMPSMEAYNRDMMRQAGRTQELLEKKAEIAKRWEVDVKGKDVKEHENLSRLMSASTLGEIDPTKPFEPLYTDEQKASNAHQANHDAMREGLHADLKARFDALSPAAKRVYKDVRDSYAEDHRLAREGVDKRIQDAKLDDNTKKELMATLRQKFEAGKIKGPYFALARWGDRWGVAKHADGTVHSFVRRESKAEMAQWMEQMKKEGFTGEGQLDGGEKVYHRDTINKIDPEFVAKVDGMFGGLNKDGAEIDPGGTLRDDIWQEYMKSLPEMSMRKQFIHRQGRLGFSGDQMRAFADRGLHSAHQIARLEYGNKLDKHIEDMEDQRRAIEQANPLHSDADRANALAYEYAKRHEIMKNPQSSPLTSMLTKAGSNWYLSFSPGTAIRVLMQNPMIALPTLGGTHGFGGAYRELTRASIQWMRYGGDLASHLAGDEKLAFEEARKLGIFTNTETRMLSSGGTGDPMYIGKRNMAVRTSQFLFNGAEHLNRQSTFLAAYRLATKDGMNHEDAFWSADKMARDSHFDYSPQNRPRIMRGNVARVVGLFKTYPAGVTYRLGREFVDAISHDDPDTKAIARKTFAGLIAHQWMFGGAVGLPFAWAALAVASYALGTKNMPYDARGAAHAWLSDNLPGGRLAADAILTGPAGAITGASLSGAANYSDLWYRSPEKDMTLGERATDAMAQSMGAVAAVPLNAITGLQMGLQGHVERGAEHFVPPFVASLMKTLRYSKEGLTTLDGEVIMSKDEISGYELALQAVGQTPQRVADTYAWAGTMKNTIKEIEDRKNELNKAFVAAVHTGDPQKVSDAAADLGKFRRENPGLIMNPGASMLGSVVSSAKKNATQVAGVTTPPALRGPLNKTYGAAPFPKDARP